MGLTCMRDFHNVVKSVTFMMNFMEHKNRALERLFRGANVQVVMKSVR